MTAGEQMFRHTIRRSASTNWHLIIERVVIWAAVSLAFAAMLSLFVVTE